MFGKLYIGHTCDLRQRLESHDNKPPTRMKQALGKQRLRDVTTVMILHEPSSESEAKRMEKVEILCRRTREPAFGYNILKGTPACDTRFYHMMKSKKKA